MKLELDRIRLDGATQPRAKLQTEVIEEYAEQMRDGVVFPSITVFFDGSEYWLADGFHRVHAARRIRPSEPIEAKIIQGTKAEAQWYSFGVNKTHGLRRTREDRVRAIRAALQHTEATGRSDSDIARHVGVSHPTVAKYRAELEQESTCKIFKSSGEAGKSEAPSTEAESEQHPPAAGLPPAQPATPRLRTGRDGRTINTAKIGKGSPKRSKPGEVKISPRAFVPKLGHSLPNPMICLQFSPNNAHTAAATLVRDFSREWVEQLVQELNRLLSTQGAA